MKFKIYFLALLLSLPLLCPATDLKPWFGNEYEAELRVNVVYQHYDSIATPAHHHFKRHANDTFTTLSAAYPFKRYSGEFEVTGAHTRHQSHRIDNFRITGRYQWLSEPENRFSLVTSLTFTEPLSRALHDISSFHHGHVEGEFDLSFGKKFGDLCDPDDYRFRWWTILGVGTAEEGSPWTRLDLACEYKFREVHEIRGIMETLWGCGSKNLHPDRFRGYGSIRHRSVDLGIRYGYILEGWGTLSLQVTRRVYADNFPRQMNRVMFEYYYPFGSQVSTNY